MLHFVQCFQIESVRTRAAFQLVADAGLLQEQEIKVDVEGAPSRRVNGFRTINMEKFDALPDETFLQWRRNGLLPLIFAHFASLGNVNRIAGTIGSAPAQ